MVDCRGKLLRAGDTVAIASQYGQTVGSLRYDPDDIRYLSLHVDVGDRTVYKKKRSSHILNVSELQRELDTSSFVVVY